MSGKYLLDSSVVIEFLRNDLAVQHKIAAAGLIAIPAPALGELYHGALRSHVPTESAAQIDEYVRDWVVIPVDADVAREWALVKNQLRQIGKPIPENDIWIAAIARQHGFTLVTRDAHFRHVNGITIENW